MRVVTRRILPIALLTVAVSTATAPFAVAQDAKKGETVYGAQKCQVCHAIGGKGNKQNPLDGVAGKLSAAEIKQWITTPIEMTAKAKSTKKPPMPDRFSKLPAADIDDMVAYLQTLK